MRARILALLSASVVCSAVGAAQADSMDPAIERLVLNPECRNELGQANFGLLEGTMAPTHASGSRWCQPDEAQFLRLVNQWGYAFAPSAMHSARTTGVGGFHLSAEAVYTNIDSDADYWVNGTRGPDDPTTDRASIRNESPRSILQVYSVKLRKGFGFGLELTGSVGMMPQTNIFSVGADLRLSLLEGFRSGIPGYLPDVAAGGGVRTITGTPQFQLTIAAADAQISKPIPIADTAILTPWVGFQHLWIFGDSGLVDLTPATDAVQYCNFSGTNQPGNQDPAKDVEDLGGYDGQPVCRGEGSSLDFNNNVVFDQVRLERQRLLVGLNYRFEVLMVGAQFAADVVSPADAQTDEDDAMVLEGVDRQWSLMLELGGMF